MIGGSRGNAFRRAENICIKAKFIEVHELYQKRERKVMSLLPDDVTNISTKRRIRARSLKYVSLKWLGDKRLFVKT